MKRIALIQTIWRVSARRRSIRFRYLFRFFLRASKNDIERVSKSKSKLKEDKVIVAKVKSFAIYEPLPFTWCPINEFRILMNQIHGFPKGHWLLQFVRIFARRVEIYHVTIFRPWTLNNENEKKNRSLRYIHIYIHKFSIDIEVIKRINCMYNYHPADVSCVYRVSNNDRWKFLLKKIDNSFQPFSYKLFSNINYRMVRKNCS